MSVGEHADGKKEWFCAEPSRRLEKQREPSENFMSWGIFSKVTS